MPEGSLRYLLYGDVVAVNLALAMVLGGLASDFWLSRHASGWAHDMARKARRVWRRGFSLGLVALLAMWWLQAASMSDVADVAVGAAAWTLLRDTHFGHAWIAGLVGWSLATAATWSVARGSARYGHHLVTAAGLTAYDAAYVAIAEDHELQFVTDDEQLAAAVPHVAIALADR